MTFETFSFRRDRALTAFKTAPADHAAMLRAICCNAATGYVRDNATSVLVPNHAATAVASHLASCGWTVT